MKVSVITVTMNSEKYLADCIRSVQEQTYSDIEHIIVDGKSTDGTLKIIHRYRDHLAKWISESDRGMYDAINKGIAMATGEIIGILNSDDVFASPDVIANIADGFKSNNVDSIYGDLVYVRQSNTDKIFRLWKGLPYKRRRFNFGWMPAHPTFYMKRSLIEKYGLYENHYFSAADYEFMARYLYRHKISSMYLSQLVVKMRTGGASNGSIKKWLRANRRDYLAMRRNGIPFSFFVSIIKPLSKIRQFNSIFNKLPQPSNTGMVKPSVTFFKTEGNTTVSNAKILQ